MEQNFSPSIYTYHLFLNIPTKFFFNKNVQTDQYRQNDALLTLKSPP